MILYFETLDSGSFLSEAHSVYVTRDDEFSLSVKKIENAGTADHYLVLAVSGNEYLIEKCSGWLDSGHTAFYWKERVIYCFNNIIKRFTWLAERAATRVGCDTIDIASLINDEYERFEREIC